jgi:hypothetical protein
MVLDGRLEGRLDYDGLFVNNLHITGLFRACLHGRI